MRAFFSACLVLSSWLVSSNSTHAQTIANLNLDTWAVRNGVEAPTNWQTTDDLITAALGIPQSLANTGAVTKSTDAHGGTYAAKLTTASSVLFGATPGVLILGTRLKVNLTASTLLAGLPYTTRPTQLQFYYKLTNATDQPLAGIILTRTVNGTRQQIGTGNLALAASSTYTLASVPIQYSASTAPDSVTVLFSTSSSTTSGTTVGTTLLVDDVTFSSAALAVRADADVQSQFTVAPNPSTGGRFQLAAPSAPALTSAPLTVLDLTGRVVMQQPALAVPAPIRELDLSSLAAGSYLLRLDTPDGAIVRQLSIK